MEQKEINRYVLIGSKYASKTGSAKDKDYLGSLKKVLQACKVLIRENEIDAAFKIAKEFYESIEHSVKRTAVLHCNRLFLYCDQPQISYELACISARSSKEPALKLAVMTAQDLYRKGSTDLTKKLLSELKSNPEDKAVHYVDKLNSSITPTTTFDPLEYSKLAIEHVKQEKESFDPDQVFALCSATFYCRKLFEAGCYDELLDISKYLCTDDLGLMKSDLVLEIATNLLDHEKQDIVLKISEYLLDINNSYQLKTLKIFLKLLKRKGLKKEAKQIYQRLQSAGIKNEVTEGPKSNSQEPDKFLNLKRIRYTELLDNELHTSKHDLSSREVDFIDHKTVKQISGIFDTILGRSFTETQMKFFDQELNSRFDILIKRDYWKVIKREGTQSETYSYNLNSKLFNLNDSPGEENNFNDFISYLKIPFDYSDEKFDAIDTTFR